MYPSVSKESACWVFSCFRNPPNSGMDYRIFHVCMWSFLCMRMHTGVGHTDSESAQHFDSEKLSQIFLVLLTGFEPWVIRSWVRRSANWASLSPRHVKVLYKQAATRTIRTIQGSNAQCNCSVSSLLGNFKNEQYTKYSQLDLVRLWLELD